MNNPSITFISNFLVHHQTPFCEAMVGIIGDSFHFVATLPIPEERLIMGYHDYTKEPYAINAYENEELHQYALELGRSSDVVIIGSAPDEYILDRLAENKLTFRYCERFFKEGYWRILDPRVLFTHYNQDFKYRRKSLYMLCASAYTAQDCRLIGSYPHKTYKWGYFPEVKKYDEPEKIIGLKHPASILWVGRLIGLKHPETVILLAEQLKRQGYIFSIIIIGSGVMETSLRAMVEKKKLSDCITLIGFMPPEEVRRYMEQSDIFLFTSDKNEGWGAVLNESMNSACAVVTNREIGSVPYLIMDGENGLIYNRMRKNSLFECVCKLLDDNELKHQIQVNAYTTMHTTWNAKAASERLLGLIYNLQNDKGTEYEYGPCSKDW